MIQRGIARRYAQALLELSGADAKSILSQLRAIITLLQESRELREVLQSPAFSKDERRHVLVQILDRLSVRAPVDRFLELLLERDRLRHLEIITDTFENALQEQLGQVRVRVDSAIDLDEKTLAELKTILATQLKKQILLETNVNPALIGGLSIQVGSQVVDGTLLTQLRRLSADLR